MYGIKIKVFGSENKRYEWMHHEGLHYKSTQIPYTWCCENFLLIQLLAENRLKLSQGQILKVNYAVGKGKGQEVSQSQL